MSRRTLAAVAGAVVAIILCVEATGAAAAYDPISSGTTTLTLAPDFTKVLKADGVRLSGTGGVTVKGGVVTFAVAGGKLEPVEAKGVVEHSGSLVFKVGGRSLPLRALQLKSTRRTAPYAAKLGGGQLKLATTQALKEERLGFGSRFRAPRLLLTANAATRLDKKLGLPGAFEMGQLLGSSQTDAQPGTVTVKEGGTAELTLAPEFAAKLSSLFVAVNPVFPAERLGPPFTLRVIGGQIAPDASSGTLETAGSLELIQQDGGQAFFRELAPELGLGTTRSEYQFIPSPTAPGPTGIGPLLGLGAGTVVSDPKARTIGLAGSSLPLSAATVLSLNETFAKPQGRAGVFQAGESLGTLSFTVGAE